MWALGRRTGIQTIDRKRGGSKKSGMFFTFIYRRLLFKVQKGDLEAGNLWMFRRGAARVNLEALSEPTGPPGFRE